MKKTKKASGGLPFRHVATIKGKKGDTLTIEREKKPTPTKVNMISVDSKKGRDQVVVLTELPDEGVVITTDATGRRRMHTSAQSVRRQYPRISPAFKRLK